MTELFCLPGNKSIIIEEAEPGVIKYFAGKTVIAGKMFGRTKGLSGYGADRSDKSADDR